MPQRWPEAAQASKRKQSRAARRRRRKKLSISFTRGTDPPPKSPAMLRPPRASASTAGKQSSAFRIPRRRQPVEHQATISKPPTPAMAAPLHCPTFLHRPPGLRSRHRVLTPDPGRRRGKRGLWQRRMNGVGLPVSLSVSSKLSWSSNKQR